MIDDEKRVKKFDDTGIYTIYASRYREDNDNNNKNDSYV